MVLEYTVYSPAPPPTDYKHPHPNLIIYSSFNNAPGIVFIGDYLWTPYLKAQGISDTKNPSIWKRMISYFTKRRGTITFTVPNHPSLDAVRRRKRYRRLDSNGISNAPLH